MSDTPSWPPAGHSSSPQQHWGGEPPSYGTAPPGPSGPRATFGQRLGAWLLDTLVVGAPLLIIFLIIGAAGATGSDTSGDVNGAVAAILLLLWLLLFVAPFVYYIVLEGGPTGQTLGKKAVGIRVVSMQTGGPIGYGKATARMVIRTFVSGNCCLLGHLWMLWDQEKQTWHDKISDSVVVPVWVYPIQR